MNKVVRKTNTRKPKATPSPMDKIKMHRMLVGIVVVLLVVLIVLVALQMLFTKKGYSAVYLRSGDLYFGRMVKFPAFGLKNVYTIQVTQDPQVPLRIQKFSDIFWGPEDYLKINPREVVWTTQLKSEGQLYQLLKTNPNLTPQQNANNYQEPVTTNPTSSAQQEEKVAPQE
jgi:hypothetical protein